MKFQKFYIYFCSLSWAVWLISIITLDLFWKYRIFDSTYSVLAAISAIFTILPIHLIFSVIALVKSIKAERYAYMAFNIISMFVSFFLGAVNCIYCLVYYSGGV